MSEDKGLFWAVSSWWKKSALLGERYHASALYFFIDRIFCRYRYGATSTNDYEFFRMYALNSAGKNALFTEGRYFKSCDWFTSPQLKDVVNTKIGFMSNFKEFHKRSFLVLPCDESEVRSFINKHGRAFLKKNSSNGGHGVSVITSHDIETEPELVNYVANFVGVLDEPVVQHPEMARLNNLSVSTVRITTMVEKDGNIKLLAFFLRVGKEGNFVDNICSGGALYRIDRNEGIVVGYGRDFQGNVYIKSPTGVILPGFRIPYWNQIIESVKNAARKFPQARFVGWDIAISDKGPVFIESNMGAGPDTLQPDIENGIWHYLKQQR